MSALQPRSAADQAAKELRQLRRKEPDETVAKGTWRHDQTAVLRKVREAQNDLDVAEERLLQ